MPQDLTPQLRTRLNRVERLVGLFVGIAFVLAIGLFSYFTWHTAQTRGWFKKKARYFTYAEDATGLKKGNSVTLNGFTIGKITDVNTMPMEDWAIEIHAYAFVEFEVLEPWYGYVLTDSEVKIGAGDFLGTRALEVIRGSHGLHTATNLPTGRLGMLHKQFGTEKDRQKATNQFLVYFDIKERPEGYYLHSREDLPLPTTLSLIAADVRSFIPALTNRITSALDGVTSVVAKLDQTIPRMTAAVDTVNGLVGDLRPSLAKPGGLGDLLIPTNLNAQLLFTLSNVNSNTHSVAPLLSNVNLAVSDIRNTLGEVRGTVETMRSQLEANTNLVSNVSQLSERSRQFVETLDTLMHRHWLFRSAFKTNPPAKK
jgi:ABC-type transporter Mla subunit MlaD